MACALVAAWRFIPLKSAYMLEYGAAKLSPSIVIGESVEAAGQWRTSSSTFFIRSETSVHSALEVRARSLSRFQQIEGLQLVRYQRSQHYSPHYDYFQYTKGQALGILNEGQRTATLFLYLNDVPVVAEGETVFPRMMNLRIRPRRNAAAFWYNVMLNGYEDLASLHGGLPVKSGREQQIEKYAVNFWTRDRRLIGPQKKC